jgi:hypothetical protein
MAPIETGAAGSSSVPWAERRQHRVDLVLVGDVDLLEGVREHESRPCTP